ncbi:MAG: MBL fold metallo-hydrolase [Chitinophagales bacterium]
MIAKFTFNPIQENTYILYDETGSCVIIDPGCVNERERQELVKFIDDMQLQPVRLLNTHCHIDHIPGNPFIAKKYGLKLEIHQSEVPILKAAPDYAPMFLGTDIDEQPELGAFIKDGESIRFGETELQVLHTPGHSPGSVTFYNKKEGFAVVGDVLFYRSIGRYDLPGAHGPTLFKSISEKVLALPDSTIIYSGHGPETSIGGERLHNPFLQRLN